MAGAELMTEQSNWRAIVSAFLVGIAGAVQVGRVAPVAPFIQQEIQLDLITLGWLVSLITLASALFGLLTGYWVVRYGLRASVLLGALLMAACAAGGAISTSVPMLIGARIIEGFGYLIVVVAAPTLIARETTPKDAPFALALWGTFFTLGLSFAAFAGGVISEAIGWRGWFWVSAGLALLAATTVLMSISKDEPPTEGPSNLWKTFTEMPRASWLLGAAFLGLTLLTLAILSLLPTFLMQKHSFTPTAAGGVTGGVALASIAGSLSYGMFANRISETIIACGASIVLIASAFPTFASVATPGQIIPFAAVATFMSGILVAQTFAAVPRIAGTPRLIGPSNGLVAQLGSIGALTGPPLVGGLISVANWNAVPMVVAGFTISFAILFILAMKSHVASPRREVT
jgi:MFS family permease